MDDHCFVEMKKRGGRYEVKYGRLYGASIAVYGISLLFIWYLDTLFKYLDSRVLWILGGCFVSYIVLAPLYYHYLEPHAVMNKPLLILQGLRKVLLGRWMSVDTDEKVAFLFWFVKLFFLPMMINFLLGNMGRLLTQSLFSSFSFLLILLFTIDTIYFTIGYILEMPLLGNVVKSVDSTFLGWIVALVCYPPFNYWVGNYIPWGAHDLVYFGSDFVTAVARVVLILLLLVYVWASVALGFKASNLTNRGIVTKFPYSLVRHPAYMSKNLFWWITLIPVISWKFALGLFFWSVIYYFRAVTEERHLGMDPEYRDYSSRVKWKFIPKVW